MASLHEAYEIYKPPKNKSNKCPKCKNGSIVAINDDGGYTGTCNKCGNVRLKPKARPFRSILEGLIALRFPKPKLKSRKPSKPTPL